MEILVGAAMVIIVFYPWVFFILFLPPYLITRLTDKNLSHQEILSVIETERVRLGINSNVAINLILVHENNIATTGWDKPEGPFYVNLSENGTTRKDVRHELFHIKRALKTRWTQDSNKTLFILKYFYIEEPSAMLYEYGIRVGA